MTVKDENRVTIVDGTQLNDLQDSSSELSAGVNCHVAEEATMKSCKRVFEDNSSYKSREKEEAQWRARPTAVSKMLRIAIKIKSSFERRCVDESRSHGH